VVYALNRDLILMDGYAMMIVEALGYGPN